MKVAAVALRAADRAVSLAERWGEVEAHVYGAAQAGCALLVLPEHFLTTHVADVTEGRSRVAFAEPVGGPSCQQLCTLARNYRLALVGGVLERDGERLYNTVVGYAADGTLVGCYRKVHPTPYEIRTEGIVPGTAFSLFRFPFGPVGVLNCMDLYFPEAARVLALLGAQLLLWPTTAYGPTAEQLLTLCRARAIENAVWLVSANFACDPPYAPYLGRSAMGRAFAIDRDGTVVADTGHRPGLAIADVDLAKSRHTAGVVGARDGEWDTLPEDLFAMRRPQAYGKLCAPVGEP